MCRGGAAPGVDEELQVLLAAWLPLGDRLLRRLLALLGGLVTRVQLHRSACAHARALRVHMRSGGLVGSGMAEHEEVGTVDDRPARVLAALQLVQAWQGGAVRVCKCLCGCSHFASRTARKTSAPSPPQ